MKESLEYNTFHELHCDLGLTIRAPRQSKWRVLYPNAGMLRGFEHLGTVQILCTDGTEAYFHVGRKTIFHGHLRAFTGPVAKSYVWDCDWDFVRCKRKVSVFKRRDGSYAVIPHDKDMEEYKEMHSTYVPFGHHPDDEGYNEPTASKALNASRAKSSRVRQLFDTI